MAHSYDIIIDNNDYKRYSVHTDNKNIRCLIEISYNGVTSNEVTFNYAIHFYRINNHTKSYTNNINYTTYLNGSILKNWSTNHTVSGYSGSGDYIYNQLVFWETKKVSRPDAMQPTNLNFRFVASGNVAEYNLDESFSLQVPSYSSPVGVSKVTELKDTGHNSFNIKVKLGKNGANGNNITDAHIYYTENNEAANRTSSYYSLWTGYGTSISSSMGGGSAGSELEKTIPLSSTSKSSYYIKARPYSIASQAYGSGIWSNTTNPEGNIYPSDGSVEVKVYKPPVWSTNDVKFTCNNTRPVPDSIFTVEYPAATAGNANSLIKGYDFRVFYKSPNDADYKEIYQNNRGPYEDGGGNSRKITFSYGTIGKTKDFFQKDGRIKISLQPYTYWGDGALYYGAKYTSSNIKFNSKGIVRLKYAENKPLTEGIVYIRTSNTTWAEADCVYIYTSNGWKESI